ncbi:hypothetical protein L204_101933 [Cryptococcus depauperatus]
MLNVPEGGRLAPADARRTLGIRPGGPPSNQIILDQENFENLLSPTNPDCLSSSRLPIHLQNPSLPFPSRFPSSEQASSPGRQKIDLRHAISDEGVKNSPINSRGLYETQKLLLHLLDKLEMREQAPDILERAAISAREISSRMKGKWKGRVVRIGQAISSAAHTVSTPGLGYGQGSTSAGTGIGSEDLEDQIVLEEGEWDTESTYDLVEQTRGLFSLAEKQGLDLFSDSQGMDITTLNAAPVKIKRRAGRFSSVSPGIQKGKQTNTNAGLTTTDSSSPRASTSTVPSVSGSYLLEKTLAVLQSLTSVDSLHPIRLFRPLLPPHAMQAACLDIASYIYRKGDEEIKIKVVSIMIDGWYSMGKMEMRVVEWLEGRIEDLLKRLARERREPRNTEKGGWAGKGHSPTSPDFTVPTVAISDATDTSTSQSSTGWKRFSPTSTFYPSDMPGLLYTQSIQNSSSIAINIAALIPRLLTAIISTIEMAHFEPTAIFRIQRLISLTIKAKPDVPLDLLEIIAYAPPGPRRIAAEILSTFFPSSMGHNMISRRLATFDYKAQRIRWETGQSSALGEDQTEDHHFIPWRFSSNDDVTETIKCSVCGNPPRGFGLQCTMCKETRHLNCFANFDQGNFDGVFVYEIETLSHAPSSHERHGTLLASSRYTNIKFCPALPSTEEKIIDGNVPRCQMTCRRLKQHDLFLANLFTLTLCGFCCKPLWGLAKQAYACRNDCQRFFHPECINQIEREGGDKCRAGRHVTINEVSKEGKDPFVISLDDLQASFKQHYEDIPMLKEDMFQLTFDEMGVCFGMLWIQHQLVKNGIASGSLRVHTEGIKVNTSDPLDLRPTLRVYEECLQAHDQKVSPAMADYIHFSNLGKPQGTEYIFSGKWLAYVTALLRTPTCNALHTEQLVADEVLLTPQGSPTRDNENGEDGKCYETLSLEVVTQSLAFDLYLKNERISVHFIHHLALCGFISVPHFFQPKISPETQAGFILPLLMDASPTTEILVLAIEALLNDLDLALNELGLRLICTRAWPSLLCLQYFLERLGKAVLGWLMSEEECLRDIIKIYASQHRRIPGVRSSPVAPKGSVDAYKADRQRLGAIYVKSWLHAMHDLYPDLYAVMVYDRCKHAAENIIIEDMGGAGEVQRASKMAGITVSKMVNMGEAGVLFSTVMEILTKWLEDLGTLAEKDVVYRALPRLLNHQHSNSLDIMSSSLVASLESMVDFTRVCRWMRVLSFSGVEIPWEALLALVDQQATGNLSTRDKSYSVSEAKLDLVIAVGANCTPIEASKFIALCARVGTGIFTDISNNPDNLTDMDLDVVQRAMLLILQAYGVTVDDIIDTSFGSKGVEVEQTPSTIKKRQTVVTQARVQLDADMVLTAARLLEKDGCPCEIILDFLWLLSAKAAMVDDLNGSLYQISPILYNLLWPLLDCQIDRRSRARILLKLLSVNPAPLDLIIRSQMHSFENERMLARERLVTFIIELADQSITYEVSNWRDSAVSLILIFFEILMSSKEPTPNNLIIIKALLPIHLKAISICFEEYLLKSSDERRLALLTHLSRIRLALPDWGIISWVVIDELLDEEAASLKQFKPIRQSDTVGGLADVQNVTYSLISFGLEMLASGVTISWMAAQRFARHVKAACSSPWLHSTMFTAAMLPALRSVLDSSARILISSDTHETKTKKSALVGNLFTGMVIEFGDEIEKYDFISQRTLLDIMMIVFFKQNVVPIQRLARNILFKIADLVSMANCSQNRLLALQVLQVAIIRVEREAISRAIPLLFSKVAITMVNEIEAEYGDQAVIEQCQSFLKTIVNSFGRSGLYQQLFLNDSNAVNKGHSNVSPLGKAFQVLYPGNQTEEVARVYSPDRVFKDLLEAAKGQRNHLEIILQSFDGFVQAFNQISESGAQEFGSFLNKLSKTISENAWDFDPNPILRASNRVLCLTPSSSAVHVLNQISAILSLCLENCKVERQTIVDLFETAKRISEKTATDNQIERVLFQATKTIVSGLPIAPVSLYALLDSLTTHVYRETPAVISPVPTEYARLLSDIAPGCVKILFKSHPVLTNSTMTADVLLGILTHTGMALCQAEILMPGLLGKSMSKFTLNATSIQLHFFLFLLLSSLNITMGDARTRLYSLYPILSRAIALCLRASADYMTINDSEGNASEMVSLVFMVFRVSLLAIHDGPLRNTEQGYSEAEDDAINTMWSRVWPEWSRLITFSFDQKSINGGLKSVTQTVLLDLIIFLGDLQSPVLLRHSENFLVALAMLRYQEKNGISNTSSKIQKATQTMEKIGSHGVSGPPDRVGIVTHLREDLLATERIKRLNKNL